MAKRSYEKYFKLSNILNSIKEYLPGFNEKKFIEAFNFAEKAHLGQFRKDNTTPYIVHPVEIVKILISLHADEDTLISALLHDVPEDTKYTIEDVEKLFGDKIKFLVDGITKLSAVYYQNDMSKRQVGTLKKLFLHSVKDLRVILIKLADRLHNMQTLGNIKESEKRMRISRETLEIYVPIANLLGIQDIKSQLEDLCFQYLFPTEFEKLNKKRNSSYEKRKKLTDQFVEIISNECRRNRIRAEFFYKEKALYSIFKKLSSMGKSTDETENRIALKVIVKTAAECYEILGIVHSKFVPMNDRFRDYIANPKVNGYQSLHTAVFGVGGIFTELQICTVKMNFESAYGITAGFFMDKSIDSDKQRANWLKKVLDLEKSQDPSTDFVENLKLDILQDRIFAFTTKGKAVDLPKGASVIDFAYANSAELGNHVAAADINGKRKPISTALKTGDVVNIVLSKKVTPEISWLSLTKTNLAKEKILAYLKKISIEKKRSDGHKILQKEFDIADIGLCENMNFRRLKKSLKQYMGKDFANLESLFVAIGEGESRASDVIKCIEASYKHAGFFMSSKKTSASKREKNVKVLIKIVAKNRFGLLRDIAEVLYKNVLDMYSLKGWASSYEEDAYFSAELLVEDLETVSHIFDELYQIEGVVSVCRISPRGIISFYISAFVAIVLWIFHPFVLRIISKSDLTIAYPLISDMIVYFGLLVLIFIVIYLTTIVREYFPFVRKKKLLWIIAFSIPLFAVLTLLLEIFLFKLELSITVLFIELLLIYAYLLISYVHFKKTIRQI